MAALFGPVLFSNAIALTPRTIVYGRQTNKVRLSTGDRKINLDFLESGSRIKVVHQPAGKKKPGYLSTNQAPACQCQLR